MSRIGKLPIKILDKVEVKVNVNTNDVEVKGPKGLLKQRFNSNIQIEIKDGTVFVKRNSEEQKNRALHGLTRTLINNMVLGVTQGFEKKLAIVGVGYKAQVKGKDLVLNLGFSHPVTYHIPSEVTVTVDPKSNEINIIGINKELIGQVAAEIRRIKEPEPYKGRGIRYLDEKVRRKAGKTVSTAGAK